MSFRGRLALFFLLIVAIPVAAIGFLVVDVTQDSQAGKADARLSTGLSTALTVYEDDREAASDAITELLTERSVTEALGSRNRGQIRRRLAAAARREGLEALTVTAPGGAEIRALRGGERAIATASVRTTGRSGDYTLTGSVTGPTEYIEEVGRLTGLDVGLAADSELVAGGGPGETATELPPAGESADVEVGGETLRAAAGQLPEAGATRVVVFTETETGGFFDSSPRIVAALAVFLAVALAFIALLFRMLQGQIGSMLEAARRIGSGDFSARVPVVGGDEMAGLAGEFNQMSERLAAQIEQLRNQRTELDRLSMRMAEAAAAGLDQEALMGIVLEAALGGCAAEYAVVELDGGTLIERPEGSTGPARTAAKAGRIRAAGEGVNVAARRGEGHALAAPLERDGVRVGALAVGRRSIGFDEREREVFLHLLNRASESIENVSEHQRVSAQAVTDELTGLANNRAFRETLEREAQRAKRFGHELSLVILDLDDFKKVNDRYGHLQGDEVLRTVGEILKTEPRAIDEPARYGGEEFVVALPETGSDGAVELAERIRTRLEGEEVAPVDGGKPLRVTMSIGTATLPDAAGDVRGLFEAADQALYEAKRKGKNRVVTAPQASKAR